jgi:xylulokinase
VSAGGAAWSRLPAGVPVTLAGHDHLAGLAGAATAPDDLANSVGTAETVMATFPALPDVGRALALGAAVTVAPGGEAWAAMASGARAGIVLNAAARALGQPPAALDSLVEEAPGPAPGRDDGLDGARLVRALQEGGPLDLPAVPPGELWGCLLRALSERTWEAAGRLGELAGPRRRLVVFGGGSRSGPWLRAKASLAPFGLTVWRSPTGEAAARGAAVYAGMAAGWWPTPSDAPTPPPEPVGP